LICSLNSPGEVILVKPQVVICGVTYFGHIPLHFQPLYFTKFCVYPLFILYSFVKLPNPIIQLPNLTSFLKALFGRTACGLRLLYAAIRVRIFDLSLIGRTKGSADTESLTVPHLPLSLALHEYTLSTQPSVRSASWRQPRES
jgi:hypothetical protein